MNVTQRIAKNIFALYIAQIITAILSLVFSIYLARSLGDINFGKYSFAITFTGLFGILIDLGFTTLQIRDVARDKSLAFSYTSNLVTIRIILSIIVFVIMMIVVKILHYPSETVNAVIIFGIYVIITSLATVFSANFQAFEKMEYTAVISVAGQLITVSLGLAALYNGYDLITIAFVYLIGGITEFLLSIFLCLKKITKFNFIIDLAFLKKSIKLALPIALLSASAIIFLRINIVMLSAMKGDAVVGWFSAAYNLVLSLKPIPRIFSNAIFPLMASSYVSSENTLKMACEKSLRYLLLLGLPIAIGTMMTADRIIPLFYQENFSYSIIALQILSWDVFLFFLYGPLGSLLIAINRQNEECIACGLCALINVILNVFLIPPFSYIGAAIATLITDVILLGMCYYLVAKHLYKWPFYKMIIRPILACVIMAIFIYYFHYLNLFLLIGLAGIFYFVFLILIKGISREDFLLLKKVLLIRTPGQKKEV